jgi:D-sedoheptulose 7-phosphate isomerase
MKNAQPVIDKIRESVELKLKLAKDKEAVYQIVQQAEAIADRLEKGHAIYFCGNGGSAADAQHIAAELSGRFYKNRPALKAEALHVNSSFVTAVGNDFGFDEVYARAIEAQGRAGDTLVAISTSGNSPNILKAVEKASSMGLHVWCWTGESGGLLAKNGYDTLRIPSRDTPRIQECHILVGHIVCGIIEDSLFPSHH